MAQFTYEGSSYPSSLPALFEYAGNSYEARVIRLGRDQVIVYVYDKTNDHEATGEADKWLPYGTVTMPHGQVFSIAARLGDWTESVPTVRACGEVRCVA